MRTSRARPILFLALTAVLLSVTASRLIHGQSTTSQDVGNIHVMIAAGDTLSSATPPRLNTLDAARQFYASHGDDFDVLVYFTNFVTADEGEGFFYEPLRNAVTGIGEQQLDPSDALTNYGSASRLKGSVFQGNLSIYQADLNAPIADGSPPGQGVTTLTILGQEVLHRFGVLAKFDSDPGPGITPSSAMLGRSANHWSFFLETQASVFDGVQWRADSATSFTALDSFTRFSQLDLYLMGAKPASEIDPWFLIENVVPAFSGTVQSVTTDEFPVLTASVNFGADSTLIDNIVIVNQGTSREQTWAISDNSQDFTDTSLGTLTLATKGSGAAPTGLDINAGDPFVVTFDAVGPVRHKVAAVDDDFNVEFSSGANITVAGTRRDITINDVIAVEGARVPAAAEGRTFKVAFILLQQAGSSINQTEVTKLDNIRKGFVTWFNDQTGSRLTLDTTLSAATTGVTAFTLPDNGGFSSSTAATAASTTSGYARIQPGTGRTAPAGLAIFGFTAGGVLVSEAGVPASPLIQSGRIYAEVAGAVNTGLAIANPNTGTATITFNFTDSTGTDFGTGTTTIAAGGQIAKFLNQDPFNSGDNVNGTFTFTSDVPVSVVALRGLSNERGDFLITTLPVAPLATTATATGFFPHFADGGGWTTQVILVNPTDGTLTGNVQFFSQGSDTTSGSPAMVTVNGVTASSFAYSIPGRSARRFPTSGTPTSTTAGSARIVPDGGTTTPSGLGVFSFKPGQFTVAEAGVPLLEPATAVRMYAESASPIQTGVAVANPSSTPATVTFELTTLAGVSTGLIGTATIPGDGQIAKFLDQISGFEDLPTPFQGVLRITTTSTAGLSIVGLRSRTNSRGDFLITTTSPVDENATASTAEQLFPHFADGGGWSTQFILFAGSGTTTGGDLRFLSQAGTLIDVTN